MNLHVEFDESAAASLAMYFETAGMPLAARKVWFSIAIKNPYRRQPRERMGDLLFDLRQSKYPLGTVDRSRFILQVLNESFPTRKLTDAYFENLEQLLRGRPKRSRPGEVALGIGSGRCGSTTLTAAVACTADACATHENPPLIYWEPLAEQFDFHVRRFRLLADYYALVFDGAHWWLNALERFFAEFPSGKVVGLHRDTARCAQSFMNVKGTGHGSPNHWAAPGNGVWTTTAGDPCYPSYPLPPDVGSNPDAVKAALIARYVREYNHTLRSLAERFPARLMLVRTETMSDPATAGRLCEFLGTSLQMPQAALNVGSTADSDKRCYLI